MPILAGFPVVTQTPPFVNMFKDSRSLAFRSLDGADLLPFRGREWIARKGIEGLDLIDPEITESVIPGMDGTVIDDITYGSRKIMLPIFIASDSSHAQYLLNRGRLRALFNPRGVDYRRTGGTFDLVAYSTPGDEIIERSLRCMYAGGWPGSLARDQAGTYWESIGLDLLAVQPYWRGTPWETPIIRKSADVGWFPGWPGELSSSRALGADIPVQVGGEVPSWPSVDLSGPATSVLITAPGVSISIPTGLAVGEAATIVTNPRGRTVLFDGVKGWERVAPSDRYAPLAPGAQLINVTLVGATSDTWARVYGDTLYETAW